MFENKRKNNWTDFNFTMFGNSIDGLVPCVFNGNEWIALTQENYYEGIQLEFPFNNTEIIFENER